MAQSNQPPNPSIVGFQRYFLLTTLVLLLVVLGIFINPFIVDLLFAAVIVTAVYPVHKRIMKGMRLRSLAAIISMILIIVIILLPFTLFGFLAAEQATDAYHAVSDRIELIVANGDVNNPSGILNMLPFGIQIRAALDHLPISTEDLLKTAGDLVGTISSFILSRTTNILKSLSLLAIHLIVFLMSLFFLLREGDKLVTFIRSLLPLSKMHRVELFRKLAHVSYGVIYGIFGAAILQGFLVGVGFHYAGIGNAAFWGFVAALFSPVPYLGTMVVWLPAVAVLALSGQYLVAGLLLAWSALIVGTADNFIKPFLIGSSAKLNPMALLLVLLGGTFVFGLRGLIFGPWILTLTLAFLHIYQLEYRDVLEVDEKLMAYDTVKTVKKKRPTKRTIEKPKNG